MIKLYDYQEKIINEVKAKMRAGNRRLLIQSPTGSG